MQKVLLNHLHGSKANSTDTFDLPLTGAIVFGRDPSAQVTFDPVKDDLVSRLHARLSQDPTNPTQFTVTDLNSRNGTFINGLRITNPTHVNPGDRIQLGLNGPTIEFDLDPRPVIAPPATRLISTMDVSPAMTRESPAMTKESPAPIPPGMPRATTGSGVPPADSGAQPERPASGSLGRATVERLIDQSKSSNRKLIYAVAAAAVGVIVLLAGFFIYQNRRQVDTTTISVDTKVEKAKKELEDKAQQLSHRIEKVKGEQDTTAKTTTAGVDIAEQFIPSTVFIEVSWKLIHVPTGNQVWHVQKRGKDLLKDPLVSGSSLSKLAAKKISSIAEARPVYLLREGHLEPLLSTENSGSYRPIGGSHTGSGFVVTDSGFILTNRHVAATWEDEYFPELPPLPGFVIVCNDSRCVDNRIEEIEATDEYRQGIRSLKSWIPSNTSQIGGKPIEGKLLEGRHDYLTVTFPKSTQPVRATLERISDKADVAMIKIQAPHSVSPVRLCTDNPDDCIRTGEWVTVLGYPAVSASAVAQGPSYTPFRSEGSLRVIPDATVTRGNVQKIVKAEAETVGGSAMKYASIFGDVIQLAINTAGVGNSGGPVFNDKGDVVGIFTYRNRGRDDTSVSMAVPIRHGLDLMSIQRVIK